MSESLEANRTADEVAPDSLDAGLAAVATLVLAFGAPELLRRREPRRH